jgi:hypothetical protein
VHLAGVGASDDDVLAHDVDREVVAGGRDLALVPDHQPLAREHAVVLPLEALRRQVYSRGRLW